MLDFRIIRHKDIIILDDGFSNIQFNDFSYELVDLKSINFFCAIKTFFTYILKKN